MNSLSLMPELRQQPTPQLLQSMRILQMNAQDLTDYLQQAAQENPLLEQEDSSALRGSYETLRQKASWLDGGPSLRRPEDGPPERGAADRETESLTAFLWDQLERKRLPKPLLALTKYLAELLDDDGYLAPEDLTSLRELSIPEALIRQALETLRSLDPAGVGAENLSQCLCLQLRRLETCSPALLEIAGRFLPELGRKHYGPISRALGLSLQEIQEAEAVIASLSPHPGRAFQAAEAPTVYVRPDVFVLELDGDWTVVLNEYGLPRFSLSNYYLRLLETSDERETRTYLRQKLQQASWLLHCLERRGSTLRRCAGAILETQRPFFQGQTTELAPMSLTGLSAQLGLHPSTVSRAMRDKFLQCRQGTYPLRYFFNRAVGGQGASRQGLKQRLLLLVRQEDPRHPLSDQRLCELLAEDGGRIARRTVAKYRMELGIPSSGVRKCKRAAGR